MVGFKELLRRLQIQEQMTKQHQTRVDVSKKESLYYSISRLKLQWDAFKKNSSVAIGQNTYTT